MKIIKYPDGGAYIQDIKNEEEIIYRINNYEDLFLLKSYKDANPNLKKVVIPCMFQQQHDKRFNQNESFELKLVCDFINSCGFENVTIFHPHSDVTPALLNNCNVLNNSGFIATVFNKLAGTDAGTLISGEKLKDNLILMSTDAGGFKPLIKLCDQMRWQGETYSASKARDKDKLIQVVDKQDFEGKDVLLIDDICVFGGTFIGLAKLLKEKNVGKLYLAISHLTVEKPNPELFSLFDRVFTTNSKGIQYFIPDGDGGQKPKNLEIINLF